MEISENTNKHFFGIPPPPGYNPESIVLESADIIHSVNCHKIGCKCTPIRDCNKLDELRSQQYRESHKGKYPGVRAKRAQKQERQQQQQQRDEDFLAFPKQDDANPMEVLLMARERRRPRSRIDSENVRIFRCRYCAQPVTYGYGSVRRDGRKILTNIDGTMHIDKGEKK